MGHSSNDLEFFIDHAFRASTLSFSAMLKLYGTFPFFRVTVEEEASQMN